MGVVSVTSSQKALERFPDIEHISLKDISISASLGSSLGAGSGGKMPFVRGSAFRWGFTVTSLAPGKYVYFNHFS